MDQDRARKSMMVCLDQEHIEGCLTKSMVGILRRHSRTVECLRPEPHGCGDDWLSERRRNDGRLFLLFDMPSRSSISEKL
jgi:hypothetical protein